MASFTPLATAPALEPTNAVMDSWNIRFRRMSLCFKIAEIIIGAISLGVLFYYIFDLCPSESECPDWIDNMGVDYFKYMNIIFLATTVLILIVSVIRLSATAVKFEFWNHLCATLGYFTLSGVFLFFFFISRKSDRVYGLLTVPILGFVNAILHGFNSQLCRQAGILGVGVNL